MRTTSLEPDKKAQSSQEVEHKTYGDGKTVKAEG